MRAQNRRKNLRVHVASAGGFSAAFEEKVTTVIARLEEVVRLLVRALFSFIQEWRFASKALFVRTATPKRQNAKTPFWNR